MKREIVIKIQIIWDRDHGEANEGWYARATREDGQERDLPFDARQSTQDTTLIRMARSVVRRDGFTISRPCQIEVIR